MYPTKKSLLLIAAFLTLVGVQTVHAEERTIPLVRIAELEIEPTSLPAYIAAVSEEIEASIRSEPGVLSIYAVAEQGAPNRFHFLEIYTDQTAYERHIASEHFQKYARTTQSMILSKRLIDTVPVRLGAKANLSLSEPTKR